MGKDDAIGTIGFCFGGHVTYMAATLPDIKATASFYGGGITTSSYGEETPTINRTPEIKGTIYMFYGTRDSIVSQEENEQIEAELKKTQNKSSGISIRCRTRIFWWIVHRPVPIFSPAPKLQSSSCS